MAKPITTMTSDSTAMAMLRSQTRRRRVWLVADISAGKPTPS